MGFVSLTRRSESQPVPHNLFQTRLHGAFDGRASSSADDASPQPARRNTPIGPLISRLFIIAESAGKSQTSDFRRRFVRFGRFSTLSGSGNLA